MDSAHHQDTHRFLRDRPRKSPRSSRGLFYKADSSYAHAAVPGDTKRRALMARNTHHRLLLMLSDSKPNDVDEYEGRYGVEDMRRAVAEARLQGVFPFCVTIDRQMGSYLPGIFGQHHYALLQNPQMLPTALVGWLARLVKPVSTAR